MGLDFMHSESSSRYGRYLVVAENSLRFEAWYGSSSVRKLPVPCAEVAGFYFGCFDLSGNGYNGGVPGVASLKLAIMWQGEMDRTRVYRVGTRPYHRGNFVPTTVSRQVDDRLHARGVSTSSNSSWTFSNGHTDNPKRRKTGICGAVLLAAVFIVVAAVICIGGLAFYMGAKRLEPTNGSLILDGNLRVTYGDQFKPDLLDASSQLFLDKADKYQNMISIVLGKTALQAALKEVAVMRFTNGSNLHVGFRVHLDRRKIPEGINALEIVRKALLDEFASVKPAAFRNMQVDLHRLIHNNGPESVHDSSPLEINKKAVTRVALNHTKPKTNLTPVMGTSTKMSDLGETIKLKSEPKLPEIKSDEIKSVEFKKSNEESEEIKVVKEIVKEVIEEVKKEIEKPSTAEPKQPAVKPSKVYQSIYITSDNVRISNTSQSEAPIGTFKVSKPDLVDYQTAQPSPASERIAGTYKLNNHDTGIKSDSIFTNPTEGLKTQAVASTTTRTKPTQKERNTAQLIRATTWSPSVNGHARPLLKDQVPEPVNVGFALSGPPVQDEPWRPILPTRPPRVPSTTETYTDIYDSLILEDTEPEAPVDIPITFSKKVYDENIKVTSDKQGFKNTKLSKITEEIAKKYKEILKQQAGLVSTTQEETITTATEKLTTTTTPLTTSKVPPTVVVNPFKEPDDSRASSMLNFGLSELPIYEQFHHLDSLLKSFSAGTAAGGSPPKKNLTTTTELPSTQTTTTQKATTLKKRVSSTTLPSASTRFPLRRKPTTSNDTIYVEVSTFTPGIKHRSDDNTTTEEMKTTTKLIEESTTVTPATSTHQENPYLIRGEVEVLDQPTADAASTTEATKLVTLLPVRSNVNMRTPLRPRPPVRRGRAQSHRYVDDEGGRRWIYYSSSKLTNPPEKLFIVTPEPTHTPTDLPFYKNIQQILTTGFREKLQDYPKSSPTSDIVQRIVQVMDNVAIASENSSSVIVKVNSTVLKKTAIPEEIEERIDVVNSVLSTKAVSPGGINYKLNQAGVPILTKVLRKDPAPGKDFQPKSNFSHNEVTQHNKSFGETTQTYTPNDAISSHIRPTECQNNSIQCSNGICLPSASRCNQLVDCPDASDEKNCTCAEHLKAQRLNRKLCDGVVDCWDFSDEQNCDWCKPSQYLCTNSKTCINMSQVCDGMPQCPHGDDEKSCVRVAPTIDAPAGDYHSSGFLMVRKHGVWGKLCVDNFDIVSRQSQTGWKLSDLGRSVCKALTYRDFDKVERVFSVPNEGRSVSSTTENYFELTLGHMPSNGRDTALSFQNSKCLGKQVAKVTCQDLECGLRPQVSSSPWPRRFARIVGGGNATPGAWPWQAALYKEGEFQCGATLVSNTWLISAGHCFYHNQDEWWVARLGALRTSSSLPSPHEQIRSVAQVIVHPQYVDTGFFNDIALLRLAEPVRLTDHVRPICLPQPTAVVRDGTICTVVGWGQLFELGRIFPDTLQEVQVPVITSAECRKRTVFLPLYKVTDDMLCAGYERGGRDACLGDSGGPLMCQEKDGRWSLYGVTSNGYGCARSNRPGVYTKVTRYLPWIQARIQTEAQNGTHRDRADKCKGHRCPLGECLPKSRLCNGYVECSDGSDEKDCW